MEERAGEGRLILLMVGLRVSSLKPLSPALSPFVPHGERELALVVYPTISSVTKLGIIVVRHSINMPPAEAETLVASLSVKSKECGLVGW
jgi:hypothetical protein